MAEQSVVAFGGTIQTDAAVAEVLNQDGKATGIALENGDKITATTVVSALDPRRTFMQLVNPDKLPVIWSTQLKAISFKARRPRSTLH